MSNLDLPQRLRATFLEPLVIGSREDYQIGFTPRDDVDSVTDVTLAVVSENGEAIVGSELDLSDAHTVAAGNAMLVTVYPVAGERGDYWILSTWTTALGLIHKRFCRLKVV